MTGFRKAGHVQQARLIFKGGLGMAAEDLAPFNFILLRTLMNHVILMNHVMCVDLILSIEQC
jgi:hypothetical protein